MKHSGLATVFALAVALAAGGGISYVADHGNLPHHPVNDNAGSAIATAQRIGGIRPDGTVYAGISPDTGTPIYTTAHDAPGTYNWDDGKAYCEALEEDGRNDWRMPTKGELNEFFKGHAAIGGFNISGSIPAGWYWASSPFNLVRNSAWDQRFRDGGQYGAGKRDHSSVRCVR